MSALKGSSEEVEALVAGFGLEAARKSLETSAPLFAAVSACAVESGLAAGSAAARSAGTLLLSLASDLGGTDVARVAARAGLAAMIGRGAIGNKSQLTAAIVWSRTHCTVAGASWPAAGSAEAGELERACGAGLHARSDGDVAARAAAIVGGHAGELATQRYTFNSLSLLAEAREGDWAWADAGKLKAAVDAEVLRLLGPRTASDDEAVREAAAAKKAAAKAASKAAASTDAPKLAAATASAPATAAAPGSEPVAAVGASAGASGSSNPFIGRDLESLRNSPELLAEHLRVTGGRIRTRFPPEPNGFLHIGHAKSMNLNFEGAFGLLGKDARTEGATYFRFDDTNPDKENDVYIASITENVAWLGWKPVATTHSSDYFEQLYACAERLIRAGNAYVCFQRKEEVEASRVIARARDGRDPCSPWRERPVAESLADFAAMRAGRFDEGAATLRLKIDMTSANPTMWDPVAYRIKYTPHPMTGDAWCIYPSYDFSHCIIDSLEHIDYSLCTLEFEVRRDLYYWVLEKLGMYRPYVWEFSRLNITHFMLSKRRILQLVRSRCVAPMRLADLLCH